MHYVFSHILASLDPNDEFDRGIIFQNRIEGGRLDPPALASPRLRGGVYHRCLHSQQRFALAGSKVQPSHVYWHCLSIFVFVMPSIRMRPTRRAKPTKEESRTPPYYVAIYVFQSKNYKLTGGRGVVASRPPTRTPPLVMTTFEYYPVLNVQIWRDARAPTLRRGLRVSRDKGTNSHENTYSGNREVSG